MTITFVGHGYVGLVTAAIFAELGNTVWVVGRTPEKIEKLKQGITPFYEPGLPEMVTRNVAAKRLLFTLDFAEAVPVSEVVFIAVGTPPQANGEADLSAVFKVAESIGPHLANYTVVSTKSTVPPGTNRRVGEIIKKTKKSTSEFDIASVPEFLREGSALSDTLHPDRIIIGVESKKAEMVLVKLHEPIKSKIVISNIETAELTKYSANALLSVKISFANAIAFLSEKLGADSEKVLEGVGLDRRIGRSFLYPGVGYGGSCFPKDVKALIAIAENAGYSFDILKAVDVVNKEAAKHFIDQIKKGLGSLEGKIIGVLGLSFKPNTDDMREAPSITIIKALTGAGAQVKAYDPVSVENARQLLPSIEYTKDAQSVAEGADALVVVTEWDEFKALDLAALRAKMRQPMLFDGRNIFDPKEARKHGFTYYGVGRL